MKQVKRFTETEKWSDRWFAALSPEHKLFWIHLCDTCDQAGFWNAPLDHTALKLGIANFDFEKALAVFGDRIKVLDDGTWFLVKFVRFQNPRGVSENHNYHKPIYTSLRKHGIDPDEFLEASFSTLGQGYAKGMPRDQDKGKDNGFDSFWALYSKKSTKAESILEWKKLSPNVDLLKTILEALSKENRLRDAARKTSAFFPEPLDPCRWLKRKRWMDEVTDAPKPKRQNAL